MESDISLFLFSSNFRHKHIDCEHRVPKNIVIFNINFYLLSMKFVAFFPHHTMYFFVFIRCNKENRSDQHFKPVWFYHQVFFYILQMHPTEKYIKIRRSSHRISNNLDLITKLSETLCIPVNFVACTSLEQQLPLSFFLFDKKRILLKGLLIPYFWEMNRLNQYNVSIWFSGIPNHYVIEVVDMVLHQNDWLRLQ